MTTEKRDWTYAVDSEVPETPRRGISARIDREKKIRYLTCGTPDGLYRGQLGFKLSNYILTEDDKLLPTLKEFFKLEPFAVEHGEHSSFTWLKQV